VTKRNGSETKQSKKVGKLHEDAEAVAARRSGWWISGSPGRWQRTSNTIRLIQCLSWVIKNKERTKDRNTHSARHLI